MTVQDAITKIRVMLGADVPVQEVEMEETETATEESTEAKMAAATLVDGTEVYTEGEIATGAILYIATEEDEDPFAPEGIHETTEGLLVTVGEAGEIVAIEEKAADEPVAEEAAEEATEEEMASEEATEVELEEDKEEEESTEMSSEELLGAIAELINEYKKEVKEEMNALTERFNSIADEPATKPVRNNFTKEAADKKSKAEARIDAIVSIRNSRK